MSDRTDKEFNTASEANAKSRAQLRAYSRKMFEEKTAEYEAAVESQQRDERIELERKLGLLKAKELAERDQRDEATYTEWRDTIERMSRQEEQDKLSRTGKEVLESTKKSLEKAQEQDRQGEKYLDKKHAERLAELDAKHKEQRETVTRAIEAARNDRIDNGWKAEPVDIDKYIDRDPKEISFQKPAFAPTEQDRNIDRGRSSRYAHIPPTSAPTPMLTPRGARRGVLAQSYIVGDVSRTSENTEAERPARGDITGSEKTASTARNIDTKESAVSPREALNRDNTAQEKDQTRDVSLSRNDDDGLGL